MPDVAARLTAALTDRYRIERELGSGGMATVYLAQDRKHDRKVAIKVLRPELAAVLGAERFIQEIKTTANLQHPHILPLYDSGRGTAGAEGQSEFLYYVMPYVEGETLRDKLDRETQLGIEEAVKITTEVADALDYAHRHNVIHRDIKPENILLHDGRPMVADFGIALAVSAAAGGRMTETGLSLGTPHYMSPEQATAEKDITHRSDIYSLGAVLYEMLTGEPPHTGSSAQQIIMKIVTDGARPVTELRKAVPPNVAAAVTKSLEKLPADRFTTAIQFSDALHDPAFAVTTTGHGVAPSRTAAGWRRAALTSTVIALALLVAALWGWLRGPDNPGASQGARPFTFSFLLDPAKQIAVDMDQLLFDISSDGETIAWIGAPSGSGRLIFYRSVRDLTVRPVPGTDGVMNVWLQLSPDGRQVSFLRDDELLAAPLDGDGPPQRIYDGRLWSWTWGDDGTFVVAEPYRGLLKVAGGGGEPEALTRLEGDEVTHQFPRLLPDGRTVLFSVGRGHFWTSRIEALIPDGDTTRRTVVLDDAYSATYVTTGHLVFGRGNQVMAAPFDPSTVTVTGPATTLISGVDTDATGVVTQFAVSRTGTLVYLPAQGLSAYRLAWVRQNGAVDWLGVPESNFFSPAVSPSGDALAVATRFEDDRWLQVYVIDVAREVARRLTNGAIHLDVVWSPDGDALLFNSTRDGHLNLYQSTARDAAAAVRLTESEFDQHPTDWSAHGPIVVHERLPFDRQRILTVSPTDSVPIVTRLTPDGASERCGALSPNGRWLAYQAAGHVFVREFSTGGTARGRDEQVSTEAPQAELGCRWPRWRPDGRALSYASPDMSRILTVDVDTRAGLRLGRETEAFPVSDSIEIALQFRYDVAADGRFLVVARRTRTTPMRVIVTMNPVNR